MTWWWVEINERRGLRARCLPLPPLKAETVSPYLLHFSLFALIKIELVRRGRRPWDFLPVKQKNRESDCFYFPQFFLNFLLFIVSFGRCKLIQTFPLTTPVGKKETVGGGFVPVNGSGVPSPRWNRVRAPAFSFPCLFSPVCFFSVQVFFSYLPCFFPIHSYFWIFLPNETPCEVRTCPIGHHRLSSILSTVSRKP